MVICFDEVSNVSRGHFRVFFEMLALSQRITTPFCFVKLAISLFAEITSIPASAPVFPVFRI